MRFHGGKPPRKGVLDFSSPLNPLGPLLVEGLLGEAVRDTEHVLPYPDYEYRGLRALISNFYGVGEDEVIVLNGAGEAYTLVLAGLRPSGILVLEPCYGDHRYYEVLGVNLYPVRAYKLDGNRVVFDYDAVCKAVVKAQHVEKQLVIILSNPNNPTGYPLEPRVVEELAECAPSAVLVVDEAFADFSPKPLSVLGTSSPNILVTRSFTKILAAPGIRIGFLYTPSRSLWRKIDAARQPWNVNSIAVYVMERILESPSTFQDLVTKTIMLVQKERTWLAARLRELGLTVYHPSAAPFLLIRHPSAPHPFLNNELLKRGVYVRNASTFRYLDETYSRIAVKQRHQNEKLVLALREALHAKASEA